MEIAVISHEYDDRRGDLEHAQAVIDNPDKPLWARQWAHRAMQTIIKQLKDRKLRELRGCMIRAAIAGDDLAQWKYACQIKEYLREPIPQKPTNEL